MPASTPSTADASSLWPHGHVSPAHQFSPTTVASTMPVFSGGHPFPSPNVMGFPVEMAGPTPNFPNNPAVGASGHHHHQHHHLDAGTTKRSWRINVDEFLHREFIITPTS